MRAAGLLLLLVPARGQEWITRWADDADCILDEDSEAEGGGLRQLDGLEVSDADRAAARDACSEPSCCSPAVHAPSHPSA